MATIDDTKETLHSIFNVAALFFQYIMIVLTLTIKFIIVKLCCTCIVFVHAHTTVPALAVLFYFKILNFKYQEINYKINANSN